MGGVSVWGDTFGAAGAGQAVVGRMPARAPEGSHPASSGSAARLPGEAWAVLLGMGSGRGRVCRGMSDEETSEDFVLVSPGPRPLGAERQSPTAALAALSTAPRAWGQ